MIRFSNQLWHNAVVAVTVAFGTTNVDAGGFGSLAQSAKNLRGRSCVKMENFPSPRDSSVRMM